jgi:hypothetical protein
MVHVHPEQGVVIAIGASMIFVDAHLDKLGRVPIVRIEALPSPTIRSAKAMPRRPEDEQRNRRCQDAKMPRCQDRTEIFGIIFTI